MNLKYGLQHILSGVGEDSAENLVKAAAHHLGQREEASGKTQETEYSKGQETARLIDWIEKSGLCAYWLDYFHSLLIHNFLIGQTAYQLIGFYFENNVLHAVGRQPYIEFTGPTNTAAVKEFLSVNGFQLKKNNDYFNPDAELFWKICTIRM